MCKQCDPAPYCYWCGVFPARQLSGMNDAALVGRVYCSLTCAAYSALLNDSHDGLHWCAECQQWHTDRVGCADLEPARFTIPGRHL